MVEAINAGEAIKVSLEVAAALISFGAITVFTRRAKVWLDNRMYGNPADIESVGPR